MRARAGRGRGALGGKAPPSPPCLALWESVSQCDGVERSSARYARGSAAPLPVTCPSLARPLRDPTHPPGTRPTARHYVPPPMGAALCSPIARYLLAPCPLRAALRMAVSAYCPDCPSSCRSPLPISTHSSKPQGAACRRVCSHGSTDSASVLAQPLSTPHCSHIQHSCPLLARPLPVDRAAFFALHPTTSGTGSKNAHAAVCTALYVTALSVTLLHNAVFLEHAPLGLCLAGAPRTLHYV